MQTQCFLKRDHAIILVIVAVLVAAVTLTTTLCLTLIPKSSNDVSIMSWNILAPMWIDKQSMKARGVVDMKLLNDEVRLLLMMDRVKTQDPDILHLQEVQEDAFDAIKSVLSNSYTPVAFAPNEKEYWKQYLTGNQTYVKNGVATFYKKDKFNLLSHKEVSTSSLGSVALMTVLLPKNINEKLILLNCHLETGVTPEESRTRVNQGNAITSEIEKELSQNLTKDSDSIVIIAGDLNTQRPYPGFSNFKNKGYLDAAEEVSETPFPTHYYEFPVPITENETTDWVSIDHLFIKEADKSSGKVQVSSVDVPVVDSHETTRKYYAEKLTEILKKNLESLWQTQSWRILNSELYKNIQKEAQEPVGDDNNVNRVLRLGSDHLPLTVKLHMG